MALKFCGEGGRRTYNQPHNGIVGQTDTALVTDPALAAFSVTAGQELGSWFQNEAVAGSRKPLHDL